MRHIVEISTSEILERLAANGAAMPAAQMAGREEPDHVPVVKVSNPCGAATWLLTESNPDEPDLLFGLCDLGQVAPKLGNVLRSEIEELRTGIAGSALPLERDRVFTSAEPISVHTREAQAAGRIVA
jgi:hypothetical protein